mmetsp:Transcript_11458/g.34433  ORF Transcript_11458/g.34433 Transcript_11458/m.34433 type:complete len:647 (+) Transcript_11458:108-2048(+)
MVSLRSSPMLFRLALLALQFVFIMKPASGAQKWSDMASGGSSGKFTSDLLAILPEHLANDLQRLCGPVEEIPTAGHNLTAEEHALLPYLCWQPGLVPPTPEDLPQLADGSPGDVPAGVQCEVVQWCGEGGGTCADVCRRGTVVVEPWLKNALAVQNQLARRVPFCWATMLGSHNSGITLADGYGVLDPYFQKYFAWVKLVSSSDRLQTNDQVLSLTDQMNLGVRFVELDTHWVQGDFVIAHCGGFHSFFNTLIRAVNLVAKLLGHRIRWDTETIGCDPSLSSIPTGEQRSLDSALQEVAAWMALPENAGEFIALFFDDQSDLGDWGLIPLLMSRIKAYFPEDTIYTPPHHEQRGGGEWPSADDMVAEGRRLMLTSGVDYGPVMNPLIFLKAGPMCNFFEPNLTTYVAQPDCIADAYPPDTQKLINDGVTLSGQLYRQTTCEITYGPLNCDFVLKGDNEPLLDEASLPGVTACGINFPSPDMMTPQRSAAAIWTWAPAHPFAPFSEREMLTKMAAGNSVRWFAQAVLARLRLLWARLWHSNDSGCAAISASDGRWRAVPCEGPHPRPTACRKVGADPRKQPTAKLWALGVGDRGACPWGFAFQPPATAKENYVLRSLLHSSNQSDAWLPLTGPDWKLPPRPSSAGVQ